MNKQELIEELSRKLDLPLEKARQSVNVFFDEIAISLIEGHKVKINGFGTFLPSGSFISLWRDRNENISVSYIRYHNQKSGRNAWFKNINSYYLPSSRHGTTIRKKK